jgi:hypothetical protein
MTNSREIQERNPHASSPSELAPAHCLVANETAASAVAFRRKYREKGICPSLRVALSDTDMEEDRHA